MQVFKGKFSQLHPTPSCFSRSSTRLSIIEYCSMRKTHVRVELNSQTYKQHAFASFSLPSKHINSMDWMPFSSPLEQLNNELGRTRHPLPNPSTHTHTQEAGHPNMVRKLKPRADFRTKLLVQ